MKRSWNENKKGVVNSKKPLIIRTSYFGKIINGKRNGIHKISICGVSETICFICRYLNGIKDGEAYSFFEKSGKLLSTILFKNGKMLEQHDWRDIPTHLGVVDFDDGSRWEGEVCGNCTSGRGCFFSPENLLIYEGMSVNNKREGKGISYYESCDNNAGIQYEGDWICDSYSGMGKLYDMKGNCIYDGYWMSGDIMRFHYDVFPTMIPLILHTHVEQLYINPGCMNDIREFDIVSMEKLRVFSVGNDCFQQVEKLELCNHHSLERFEVGANCFTSTSLSYQSIRRSEQIVKGLQKYLHFINNEHLHTIHIGPHSFTDYCEFLIQSN